MPSPLKLVILAGVAAGMAFALPSTPASELSADSKPPNGLRIQSAHPVTHKEIGITNLKLTFFDPNTTPADRSPFAPLATRVELCTEVTGSCCEHRMFTRNK
ncbi:hypothetical protein MD484_g3061, partial [Candolleomyces efflorescens]